MLLPLSCDPTTEMTRFAIAKYDERNDLFRPLKAIDTIRVITQTGGNVEVHLMTHGEPAIGVVLTAAEARKLGWHLIGSIAPFEAGVDTERLLSVTLHPGREIIKVDENAPF